MSDDERFDESSASDAEMAEANDPTIGGRHSADRAARDAA